MTRPRRVTVTRGELLRLRRAWAGFLADDGGVGFEELAEAVLALLARLETERRP